MLHVINIALCRFSWALNNGVISIDSGRSATKKQLPVDDISFKPNPFFKPVSRVGNIKMCPGKLLSKIRSNLAYMTYILFYSLC